MKQIIRFLVLTVGLGMLLSTTVLANNRHGSGGGYRGGYRGGYHGGGGGYHGKYYGGYRGGHHHGHHSDWSFSVGLGWWFPFGVSYYDGPDYRYYSVPVYEPAPVVYRSRPAPAVVYNSQPAPRVADPAPQRSPEEAMFEHARANQPPPGEAEPQPPVARPAPVPSSAASPARAEQPMSLADVKLLAKGGVSDEVIVSQVRNSRTVFRLTTAEILELKDSGVSDKVIDALINTPQ